MKIFAIRDESAEVQKDLAYLLYYEFEKRFYIELPEGADPWELPLLLDSFVRQNETTVNSYWSKIWVQQRIIPTDRQNIGEILRDNQLEEYDEYELLILAMGRCAQDDYYLVPIDEKDLPEEIIKRFATRIEDVLPLEDGFYHFQIHNITIRFLYQDLRKGSGQSFLKVLSKNDGSDFLYR